MYFMEIVPLPEKLRPKKLSEFVGQEHLVGKNGIIRKLINQSSHFFPSLIFWGPPGSGKTTLARIIANELKKEFHEFSAVNTKTKEIEQIINGIINSPLTTYGSQPITAHNQLFLSTKSTVLTKHSRTNFCHTLKRARLF